MARPREDVTEAELSVLQALWDRPGGATIRQLTEAVYPEGGPSRAATVQKLLERLEEKGCVARDRSGPVQRFSAAVARDALIGLRLRAVAESLCGGSLTPLLTHLVQQSRPLDPAERQALRDLIDGLDRRARPPGK
jgi:predicted transcriptional regulator